MTEPPTEQDRLEYQEKWRYVRHTEDLRYKVIQWYFVVVAAVGSFAFSQFGSDLVTTEWRVVTGFIFLYSLAIDAFLIAQKAAYQHYVDRVYDIDRAAGSDVGTPGADPALWFFGGTLLVGTAATFGFCWSLDAGGWSLGPALLYAIVFGCWYGKVKKDQE